MPEIDEALKEFLLESLEGLDVLERELLALESRPALPEAISTIFRALHTLKGTAGCLGFSRLESLAHAGESLLVRVRDGKIGLNRERVSALLAMSDALRGALDGIGQTAAEPERDYAPMAAGLLAMMDDARPAASVGAKTVVSAAAEPASVAATAAADTAPVAATAAADIAPAAATASQPANSSTATGDEPAIADPVGAKAGPAAGEATSSSPTEPAPKKRSRKKTTKAVASAEATSTSTSPSLATTTSHASTSSEAAAAPDAIPAAPPPAEPAVDLKVAIAHAAIEPDAPRVVAAADSTIRVDVGLLDKLMNLVGELVLARNQILQHSARQNDMELQATSQRLNLITSELQENVMRTRMQPMGVLLGKLPRVVRDLAVSCGKEVRLDVSGEGTELDKTLLEAIRDPLTHLVRNSVDHGIEQPDVRARKGKPREGVVRIEASHESGQVNVLIRDDGGGIDPAKIKLKAVQRGFISAEQAARLSEREALSLIFLPGFSTAEKVTNVSGRGVGMDVVRINVERIGGTVDVQSVVGEGTTFKIRIPLTLAIIPALVVKAGGERYAIPQRSLLELVRLEGEAAKKGLEHMNGAPVFRLRGSLLPLVHLTAALDVPQKARPDVVNIVVLQSEERHFGLVVDSVDDTVEIVVKPLDRHLKSVPLFAGATIMGDGRTALILDIRAVAEAAHLVSEGEARGAAQEATPGEDPSQASRTTLLLCSAPDGGRLAIPLDQVARLEEFAATSVESLGGQECVQYRGQILPLTRLDEALPERRMSPRSVHDAPERERLHVVVHTQDGKTAGLVVDRILDIVQDGLAGKRPASRAGVAFAAVIQQRVTEVLDVSALVHHGA